MKQLTMWITFKIVTWKVNNERTTKDLLDQKAENEWWKGHMVWIRQLSGFYDFTYTAEELGFINGMCQNNSNQFCDGG